MNQKKKSFELIVPKHMSMISAVTDFTGALDFDVSDRKMDTMHSIAENSKGSLTSGEIPKKKNTKMRDSGTCKATNTGSITSGETSKMNNTKIHQTNDGGKTTNTDVSFSSGVKKSQSKSVTKEKHFDLYIPSESKWSFISGLTLDSTSFKSPSAPNNFDATSEGSNKMLSTRAKPTHYDIVATVCRGRNLVAKDKSFLGQSPTSDPYVKIYYMSSVFGKTSTVQKTLTPSWGETFTFTIESGLVESNKNIEFKIFDYDLLTKDDPMGTVYVPIPIENMNNETVSWYPVKSGFGDEECENAKGELLIELKVRPH